MCFTLCVLNEFNFDDYLPETEDSHQIFCLWKATENGKLNETVCVGEREDVCLYLNMQP